MKSKLTTIKGGKDAIRGKRRDSVRAHLVAAARGEASKDWEGYALVVFRRDADGGFVSNARWYCDDPMMVFLLPTLCNEILRERSLGERFVIREETK